MQSNAVCSSIEGETVELETRKYSPRPPKKLPGIGVVYPFTLSIYGVARIHKANEEGHSKRVATSMIAKGDSVNGESIDGYALKPLGKSSVEHATGRHKASFIMAKKCYAHVQISPRDALEKHLTDAETPLSRSK